MTVDGIVRILRVENIKLEDENSNSGSILVEFGKNSDNIVKAICTGKREDIHILFNYICGERFINIVENNWKIYRLFSRVVKYNDYKSLDEYATLNNIADNKY